MEYYPEFNIWTVLIPIMFRMILAMLGHYVRFIQFDKILYQNNLHEHISYWDLKIILNYFMRVKPSGHQILCSCDASLNATDSELSLSTSVVGALYTVCIGSRSQLCNPATVRSRLLYCGALSYLTMHIAYWIFYATRN